MPLRQPLPANGRERALVIGGGIAGLTAAFRLRQRGFDVTVLELSDIVGGKMTTLRRDGWTINRAANILPASYQAISDLISELGFGDAVRRATPVLGIPRDGVTHRIHASGPRLPLDGVRTALLSPRSKLLLRNLIIDAARMKSSLSYEDLGRAERFDVESVAQYCDRRLNPEIREYVVEPVVRALFTSNAEIVSVVDFFFAAVNFLGTQLIEYNDGIDFLCREIATHVDVRTGCRATSVAVDGDGATVTWNAGDSEVTERVAACVVAVSGRDVPALVPSLHPVIREILTERLRYAVTYAAHFALRSRPAESAAILAIPRSEDEDLCTITIDHVISPACVPVGGGLVSGYWLHEWSETHADVPEDDVLAEMAKTMTRFVPEVGTDLVFSTLNRWDPAVTRSYPGWYAEVARLGRAVDTGSRLQLAGDYLSASSTNACALSGDVAAQRLERTVFGTDTLHH